MSHRALAVDEILREVSINVADIDPRTTVSLACSAKSFEEVVLSVLWKRQTHLENLIKTLHPDSWKITPTLPLPTISLTRTPSEGEWARFKRYASWMRVLWNSPPQVAFSKGVFDQLAVASNPNPVCPNLKYLTWRYSKGWSYACQFFSHSLVSASFPKWMEIGNRNRDQEFASMIDRLLTVQLERFFIGGMVSKPLDSIMCAALSKLVQSLKPCFVELIIGTTLTDPAWEHLASLPRLKTLLVSGAPSANVRRQEPPKLAFPALEDLCLMMDSTYHQLSPLFHLLRSSPMEKVNVVARNRPGDDVPSHVISAMLEFELERSVKTLTFADFGPTSLALMSNLLPFRSLKKLKWPTRCLEDAQCISPLEDSEIEKLAEALNNLEYLHLGHSCTHSPCLVTIKSMIALSAHCPHLASLDISCRLTTILDDIKMLSDESRQRLKTQGHCALRFLGSTMMPPANGEASKVASSALDNLFPHRQSEGALDVLGNI